MSASEFDLLPCPKCGRYDACDCPLKALAARLTAAEKERDEAKLRRDFTETETAMYAEWLKMRAELAAERHLSETTQAEYSTAITHAAEQVQELSVAVAMKDEALKEARTFVLHVHGAVSGWTTTGQLQLSDPLVEAVRAEIDTCIQTTEQSLSPPSSEWLAARDLRVAEMAAECQRELDAERAGEYLRTVFDQPTMAGEVEESVRANALDLAALLKEKKP